MSTSDEIRPVPPRSELSVAVELERRVRERGVRVEPRLEWLRSLGEERGEAELERRIGSLEACIRTASRKLITDLRRSGR